ncbi:DUF305 domain-containing protein [Gordonia caeni]|uniref:DUF305 domain-containing protein n=1 Tax=Gordonia caeni TaxID=1007097 RepID=A0ABP7NV18_9ACTN
MSDPRGRGIVAAIAVGTVVVFAVLGGIMLRPFLIDDRPAQDPALSVVETGFVQDMLGHHRQAVEMGKLIDRPGIDDTVRSLGRQIAQAQQFEMGTMAGWLQLAGEPLDNPAPMSWMQRYPGAGESPHVHDQDLGSHDMPGMATADEVAELGALPPQDAENRFLQLMQRHHYGGIAMAQDLTAQVPDGVVARLATSMVNSQSKETGLIGVLLTERGGI